MTPEEEAEYFSDPVLVSLGYTGERPGYPMRITRMRALWLEGKGPLAWLGRFLDECRTGDRKTRTRRKP